MELKLPAPCLLVLVGPSASGKTTWANAHFAPAEIVSSDALRATVGAGEDDQAASPAAFDLLERIVTERLRRKLTTVIDTLGYERDARIRWIEKAHESGLAAFAIVFETSPALCERRNSDRQRPIPKSVLRRQLSRLHSVRAELEEDGFDGLIAEQPVAVVAPSFSPRGRTGAEAEPGPARGGGHTFGLIVSRMDWPDGHRGEQLSSIARRAEETGFRDIWVMDHFRQIRGVGRPWEDLPEAYTALSFVAAVTKEIRLGALVTAITHRPPIVLGKTLATLDALSGGRAICGLGVAWDDEEHAAYGIEFPNLATRYELLEEALQMLPLLWGKGAPEFDGDLINSPELICYPRPVQDRLPILVGGGGEKKTLRLVARYADGCNVFGSPDEVRHKVEVLADHCAEIGRDPHEIEVTHLATALAASGRAELRARVDRLRGRTTTGEDFMRRNNAGTIDDLVEMFTRYSAAGAEHSIVAIPDVTEEGSIEAFGDVIASLRSS